jgi:hypothetical protein
MQREQARNGLPIPGLDSSFRLYLLDNPYFLFSIFVLVCDRVLGSSGCFVAETTSYSHPQSEALFSSYCLREVEGVFLVRFSYHSAILLPSFTSLFFHSRPSCIEKHEVGFVRAEERFRNRDSKYNAERNTKN